LERAEGVVIARRYRLVRKLGAGGMGSVWLAHDISLDSTCALKLIDDDKAQSDEVRVRFEREAKAAAQLRGAHVVDVFDHGESEGTLYIAMEYLQGEDLGARLDRVGRLDGPTTYRVVAHVARALVRAHAAGIVHRDLKPENIYLVQGDEEEVAKVLDFGIAKHDAYSLQGKATRTGSFLGTPFYVSPEQARGKSTDYRSDLWSLGIIVFQCLAGRPPFESEALGELMGLILYEDLPSLTRHNPELPPALDAWWQRAAARDREQRFQSAKEMADALGHALGISKPVAVPSIAPRRGSMADASGNHLSTSSGTFPPTAALPHLSGTPPGSAVLPSFSDPEWKEERVETGAPVSRTRRSAIPLMSANAKIARLARHLKSWLRGGRLDTTLSRMRAQPKRNLVVLAIGAGVLFGVMLTLILSSTEPQREPAARSAALGPPVGSAALPPATASATSKAEPSAPPPASDSSAATDASSNSDAGQTAEPPPAPISPAPRRLEGEPKRRSAPAKRRAQPPRGPDYGI
jgi:serine/threonine protein kinase